MTRTGLNRRLQEIETLNKLIPFCKESLPPLYELAMRFSGPGLRDLFVRFWQQNARCLAELESKVRDLGGQIDVAGPKEIQIARDPEEEPATPLAMDKRLLLRCINHQSHLLHLYTETRKSDLPFDLRMLFQRHQLQMRETLDHLMYISVKNLAAFPGAMDQTPDASFSQVSAA